MKIFSLLTLFLVFLVYRSWFTFPLNLSSGDWPYLYLENIREFSFFPESQFLWLGPYYQITAKIFVQYLNIPWEITEKLFWFFPFLILSVLSSVYLTRSWIGALLYTTNTYILMVVSGGQMGIALAYSIVPFVLKSFMNIIDLFSLLAKNFKFQISNFKFSIRTGLLLALLVMFDPRIAHITMIAIVLYVIFNIRFTKETIRHTLNSTLYIFLIPLAITFVLNAYWIIPLLVGGIPQEHKGLVSVAGFEFLSFTDFPHAFSFLHPNWPENIFGKTYFLQPEFLVLPILAYSSLLFLSKSKLNPSASLRARTQNFRNNLTTEQFNNRTIIFFALLGLLGAFLAKGANEPFGGVNSFLFQYFPGMNMFRDSTKFYLLISLSYSVLIPYSLFRIQNFLKSNIKYQISNIQIKNQIFNISYVFFIFAILYLILIRPAWMGELDGTFKPHEVPREYVQLKDFLKDKNEHFKTLWVPQKQRYGFASKVHPAASASESFDTQDVVKIAKELNKEAKKNKLNFLKQNNIRYIVIPFDSQKELFVDDRKYSERVRNKVISELDTIPFLTKNIQFLPIVLYEVR